MNVFHRKNEGKMFIPHSSLFSTFHDFFFTVLKTKWTYTSSYDFFFVFHRLLRSCRAYYADDVYLKVSVTLTSCFISLLNVPINLIVYMPSQVVLTVGTVYVRHKCICLIIPSLRLTPFSIFVTLYNLSYLLHYNNYCFR